MSKLDWASWILKPEVYPHEACALAFDVDPDSLVKKSDNKGQSIYSVPGYFPTEQFDKLIQLLKAGRFDEHHFTRTGRGTVRLSEFSAWCVHIGQSIPPELRAVSTQAASAMMPPITTLAPTAALATPIVHAAWVAVQNAMNTEDAAAWRVAQNVVDTATVAAAQDAATALGITNDATWAAAQNSLDADTAAATTARKSCTIDSIDALAINVEGLPANTNAPITKIKKLRRNILDSAIDKAIENAGNMEVADVYLKLKELAKDEEPPFTGVFEGDAMRYTDANDKSKKFSKEALGGRLKRRARKAATN